jgi:hypothetical protein
VVPTGEGKKIMSTPKGMCTHTVSLVGGDQVQVYSNPEHIYLQLRRLVPTEQDILFPSFKVAVELSPIEALRLASELLQLASLRLISATPSLPDVSL